MSVLLIKVSVLFSTLVFFGVGGFPLLLLLYFKQHLSWYSYISNLVSFRADSISSGGDGTTSDTG